MAKFIVPLLTAIISIFRIGIGLMFTLGGGLVLFGLLIVLGVIVGLIGLPHWSILGEWSVAYSNFPFEAIRNMIDIWLIVFFFLVLFIPVIVIILLGSSILANRSLYSKSLGWSMFGIFIISVVIVAVSLPTIIYSFKEEGTYQIENTYKSNGNDIILKVNNDGMDDYDFISLTLKSYDGQDIKLVKKFIAQGPSRKVASDNAKTVEYNVVLKDNILEFDLGLNFKPDVKFWAQRLDMYLYLPINQTIVIDRSITSFIENYEMQDVFSYDDQKWQFTENGLECISCEKSFQDSIYLDEDEISLTNFNSIELHGDITVKVKQGNEYSVRMKGATQVKNQYRVFVEDNTLIVKYESRKLKYMWKNKNVELNITMPHIENIEMSGAGKLYLNRINIDKMKLFCSGAVEVKSNHMIVGRLDITLSGASVVDISGGGDILKASISGASSLRAYDYKVERGNIKARGASNAKVFVTETLTINKTIASDVLFKGNPEIITD